MKFIMGDIKSIEEYYGRIFKYIELRKEND
jgi:hypothetical protein